MKASAALALFALAPLAATANDNGATLYATYCSSCHGMRAQGSRYGPPLVGKSAVLIHFMLDTGRMPAPAPGVNEIPREPRFSSAQTDVLTRYVVDLSPVPVDASLPRVAPGNAGRGRTLYMATCAQCHGAAADGAYVGGDDVAPDLATATAFQIGEAIRAGPGVMPRFGRGVLSDRDVDDIASFVNLARTQARAPNVNAGGLPLAHVGPVAEGLIGWLFGLGALVLFVRRIGTAGKD